MADVGTVNATIVLYTRSARAVACYGLPILLFAGVTGNVLSFIVLQSKHYRGTVPGFLLSALAVLDTLALLCGLLRRWIACLTAWKHDVRLASNAACRIHVFMTYVAMSSAVWTLVLFTIERTLVVYLPLRAKELCSLRRVVAAWICVMLLLLGFYSQMIPMHGVISGGGADRGCMFLDYYSEYWVIFDSLHAVLSQLLPWLTLAVCNLLIIVRLSRPLPLAATSSGPQRGTTMVLVAISLTFLVFAGPMAVYYSLRHHVFEEESLLEQATRGLIVACVNAAYYVTHASNFVLYSVTSSRFRGEFVRCLCRCHHKPTTKEEGNDNDTRDTVV